MIKIYTKAILTVFTLAVFCSLNIFAQWAEWEGTTGPNGGNATFAIKGDTVFAGGSGGIFLSTDNGSNWVDINGDKLNVEIPAIAVIGDYIFIKASGPSGVYLSTNTGSTWTYASSGLTNKGVTCFATKDNTIFAGTGGGVFMSTNNGTNWVEVNNGLDNKSVASLAVDGSNIFAGTGGGVYRSTNDGADWIHLDNGMETTTVYGIGVFNGNVLAGTPSALYLSTNDGDDWTKINNVPTSRFASNENWIFAGKGGGVYKSSDNGMTWEDCNNGFDNIHCVDYLAVLDDNIFAGTQRSGIYLSTNDGDDWTQVNHGYCGQYITALAMKQGDLFAGGSRHGVFRSTNAGDTWVEKSQGLGHGGTGAIAVSGNNIFASTGYSDVYLSSDNGTNWAPLGFGAYVKVITIDGNNIYAGKFYGRGGKGGIHLSTDNGANWISLGFDSVNVCSITINNGDIFIGTYDGAFLSTNNGNDWQDINNGLPENYVVGPIAINDNKIFAGVDKNGVFLSTNYGSSWTQINNGIGDKSVTDFKISNDNIFASTYWDGIYLSTNNGDNWTAINIGLGLRHVEKILISDDDIYAATWNRVFKASVSELVSMLDSIGIEITDTICVGEPYTFLISVNNHPDNIYQWFKDDLPVSGLSSDSTYTIDPVSISNSGSYVCHITNPQVEDFTIYSKTQTIFVGEVPDHPQIISPLTSVCEGSRNSYTGNTEAGIDYKWSVASGTISGVDDGETCDILWGSAGSGTVTLLHTNSTTGCSSSTFLVITINELPTPDITDYPTPVCANNEYTYTGNTEAGVDNKWSVSSGTISGADDGAIVLIVWGSGSSGTVTLVQTNATTGCSDSISQVITINPLPTPEITGTLEYCNGETGVYKSNTDAGLIYEWRVAGGTINGADALDSIIVDWDTDGSGTVTLIQTTSDNCTDSTEINVTVNALPVPILAQAPNPVCEYNTYYYVSNTDPAVNYTWEVAGGTIDAGQGSSTITVTWGEAGTEIIKLTHTNTTTNCIDSSEQAITINPLPNVGISGSDVAALDEIEQYESVVTTDLTNEWEVIGGEIQGSNTGEQVDILWTDIGIGTLKLIQTDINTGCKDSITINVEVLENPPPSITVLDSACEFNESSYRTNFRKDLLYKWTATGGDIVLPDDETDVIVRWDETGWGKVKIVQHNTKLAQYDSVETNIYIHPLPKPQITAEIDSAYENCIMLYWSNELINTIMKWEVEGGQIQGADNLDTVRVKWGAEGTGTVWLIAEDNTTGCTDSADIEINITQRPGLQILGMSEVCENDTSIYTTPDIATAINQWSVTGGDIIGETNTSLDIAWGEAGTGTIKLVQDITSMKDTAEIEVLIHQLPNVTLNIDSAYKEVCEYEDAFELVWGIPSGGAYYINDIQKIFFDPYLLGVGEHKIKYEYENEWGCSSYDTANIIVHPRPIASPNSNTFKVWSETDETAYEWYYGEPLQKVSDEKEYYPPKEDEGEYFLKVFNEWGCESELSEGVVYFPPNPEGPRVLPIGKIDKTLICKSKTYDTLLIKNVGSLRLEISKADIIGMDSIDFSILFPAPAVGINIESKDSINFIICFAPRTTGDKQSTLIIESNDTKSPTYTIDISGKKDSVGFELSDTLVSFDCIPAHFTTTKDITITNTGTLPIYWQEEKIGDDFEIISIEPNPTEPDGGISTFRILFNGGEDGYKASEEYLFTEDRCNRTVKVILQASVGDKPVDAYLRLRLDSCITGHKPGEVVKIPIYIDEENNLEAVNLHGLNANLYYNSSLLVPLECDVNHNGGRSWVDVKLLFPNSGNEMEWSNSFYVTLGDNVETKLDLEISGFLGDSISVDIIDGCLILDGVCWEGGVPRLISTEGKASFNLIRPNPTENKLTIDYELIEKGLTEIYLVNSFGERVKTIVSKKTRKGKYTVDTDLNDLSSGLYFIILQTPTVRKAEKVEVVK